MNRAELIALMGIHKYIHGKVANCLGFASDPNTGDYSNAMGELVDPSDLYTVEVPATEVTDNNGNTFICDAVLWASDGCLELHDQEEEDGYCWDEFSTEELKKIAIFFKEDEE